MRKRERDRILCLLLVLCLMGSLAACGRKEAAETEGNQAAAAQWQEQYELGIRLLNEGNYEEAILAFTAAIEIDPRNTDAYMARADIYLAWAEEDRWSGAAESGEEEWQAMFDKYIRAIEDYEMVISLDAGTEDAYIGLATVFVSIGDEDSAVDAIQRGLDACGMVEELIRLAEQLGYEVDENGQIVMISEEESVAALTPEEQAQYYMKQEDTGRLLFEDNITLFGQDVHTITLEELRAIAVGNGWDSEYLEVRSYYVSGQGQQHVVSYGPTGPSASPCLFAFQKEDFIQEGNSCFQQASLGHFYYYGDESVEERLTSGTPIGILDLCIGDSLETALTKMGFVNGEKIAAAVGQMTENYDSCSWRGGYFGEQAEALPVGAKCYDYLGIKYEIHGDEEFIQMNIQTYYKAEDDKVESGKSALNLYFSKEDGHLQGMWLINE